MRSNRVWHLVRAVVGGLGFALVERCWVETTQVEGGGKCAQFALLARVGCWWLGGHSGCCPGLVGRFAGEELAERLCVGHCVDIDGVFSACYVSHTE